MNKLILILLFLIIYDISGTQFDTLQELKTYAASYPENPDIPNAYWLDPDYTQFHEGITPSFLTRWLYELHLLPGIIWDAKEWSVFLKEFIEQREKAHLQGRQVVRCTLKQSGNFIVISDIHGELHTLVRILSYLESMDIINNKLEIIKPDYYFVVNGDLIHGSPYSLECLNIIMLLMQRNPDKVFYLQGQEEGKGYWRNYSFKSALQVRLAFLSDERVPLESLFYRFFNTLPLGLYINQLAQPSSMVLIAPSGIDNQEWSEDYLGNIAQAKNPGITYFDLSKQEKTIEPIKVKAVIRSEDWRREFRVSKGYGMLYWEGGATTWGILSGPIKLNQKFFNFFYDSFGIMTIKTPLFWSTISFYNRDIRTKDPFNKIAEYYLTKGLPTTFKPNQIPNTVNIGSSLSLVQGVPIMGRQVRRGMMSAINESNLNPNVIGHFVRPYVYNDNYEPHIARINMQRLITEDAPIVLLPTGSPTLSGYLDFIKDQKLLVLFPITGGPQFRDPELKNLIHFRASYADEVRVLIEYLYKEYNAKKFAFFYQDDAYGQGPLAAAHETLKRLGIKDITDISYGRAAANLEEQVKKLKSVQPDAIGFFSTAQATQELFRQMGIDSLANRYLFGISFLAEESFRRYIKKIGLKVLFGAVIPNPWLSQLEIIKKYREIMDKQGYPYDAFSCEAYVATTIFLEAIKKIKGAVTMDQLIAILESFKQENIMGLSLSFNLQTRSLSKYVWIERGEREDWLQFPIDHQPDSLKLNN